MLFRSLSDPDAAILRNTPSNAKRNSGYSHTRGFWGRAGWRGVYRNNLAALRDGDREAVRASEERADQFSAAIDSMHAMRAGTVLIYTLISFSISSLANRENRVHAEEYSDSTPQNSRARTKMARAPPDIVLSF